MNKTYFLDFFNVIYIETKQKTTGRVSEKNKFKSKNRFLEAY